MFRKVGSDSIRDPKHFPKGRGFQVRAGEILDQAPLEGNTNIVYFELSPLAPTSPGHFSSPGLTVVVMALHKKDHWKLDRSYCCCTKLGGSLLGIQSLLRNIF